MLVLNRKRGQTLIVGNTVIKFKELSKSSVRVGIDAPPTVRILRGELVGQNNHESPSEKTTTSLHASLFREMARLIESGGLKVAKHLMPTIEVNQPQVVIQWAPEVELVVESAESLNAVIDSINKTL